jgi:predicted ester cyclase
MADSTANAEIARQLYDRWNARDFDRVAELMANDGEIVLVGSDTRFRGPDGALEFSRMWADGFPDGRVEVDRTVASGDYVCVELTGRGTHTGTLRGPGGDLAATGRSVTLHLCDIYEIRNSKIRSIHSYFDSASMLTQLGVMPELRVEAKA